MLDGSAAEWCNLRLLGRVVHPAMLTGLGKAPARLERLQSLLAQRVRQDRKPRRGIRVCSDSMIGLRTWGGSLLSPLLWT